MRPKPPILLTAYAVTLLALGMLVILSSQTDIPLTTFLSDPSRVLSVPPYVGLFSNIGVLLWCGSAAICLLSGVVAPNDEKEWRRFFWFFGVVSSMLLVDDLFMIHETASELYWRITEEVVFAVYGIIILAFIMKCRQTLLKTKLGPLLLAFGFMGLSLLVDFIFDIDGGSGKAATVLVEDGAKLFGIVSWLVYFSMVAIDQLRGWTTVARNSQPLIPNS